MVPSFTGEIETDVPVPCSYDMDIAAGRYFSALEDGEAPLLMLFSGTAFTGAAWASTSNPCPGTARRRTGCPPRCGRR